MNKIVRPEIKFAPLKYAPKIQEKLQELSILDCRGDVAEIQEILKRFPLVPEIQLFRAWVYQQHDRPVKFLATIEDLLERYPDNLEVKVTYAKELCSDFKRSDDVAEFEDLFKRELACFREGISLATVISDDELTGMVLLFADYFISTGQQREIVNLFEWPAITHMEETLAHIAYKIRQRPFPLDIPYLYLMDHIDEWAEDLQMTLDEYSCYLFPTHDIYYDLLNMRIAEHDRRSLEEIQTHSLEDTMSNLVWLLRNGIARTNTCLGGCNQDYYLSALAIAAHLDLGSLSQVLLRFLVDLPVPIREKLFPDSKIDNIKPALIKLASHNIDVFYYAIHHAVEFASENYLYDFSLKSTLVDVISTQTISDTPSRKNKVSRTLRKLWKKFAQDDYALAVAIAQSLEKYGLNKDDFDVNLPLDDLIGIKEHLNSVFDEVHISTQSTDSEKATIQQSSVLLEPLLPMGHEEKIDQIIHRYEQSIKSSIEMEEAFELDELSGLTYGDDFLIINEDFFLDEDQGDPSDDEDHEEDPF